MARDKKTKENIIRFLKRQIKNGNTDYQEILQFFENTDAVRIVFPYDFTKNYTAASVSVCHDETGFPYVLHKGRKLYGKQAWNDEEFAEYYTSLLLEQDASSPHRYLSPERMPLPNSIIADVGGAEGIFTLEIIDSAKKSYIFECDQEWISAMRITFKSEIEQGKVEIVDAFVGDTDDAKTKTITLDTFFKDKQVDYVKADIEGAEEAMLMGGGIVFREKIRQSLLCLYHKQSSEQDITAFLKELAFKVQVNDGYMLWWGESLKPPYFRHGVVYAIKE